MNTSSRRTVFSLVFGLLAFIQVGCEQQYAIQSLPATDAKSSRTIEISTITNENKPLIKVVLVIDNSRSMFDEQAALAKGTEKLASNLRGLNVDLYVYTTSAINSALASQKATHSTRTEFLFSDSAGTPLTSLVMPPLGTITGSYVEQTVNALNASFNGAAGGVFQFRDGMSNEAISSVSSGLVSAITSIGTDGSDTEAGLCTIGRVLAAENEENAVFQPGDKAAFIIVSDTDDWSTAEACTRDIRRKEYRYTKTEIPPTELIEAANGDQAQWWSYQAAFEEPSSGAKSEIFRMSYDYLIAQTYTIKAQYLDPKYTVVSTYHNSPPVYRLTSAFYTPEFRVSYSYEYPDTCIVDEQPEPCTKQGSVTNALFDPAQAGNPPSTSGACTTGIEQFVKATLLGAGQILKSCSYKYSAIASSLGENFSPASYGNAPSGTGQLACNTALDTRARAIVPAGKVFSRCYYTYTEYLKTAQSLFAPASYGNPQTGTGKLACNSELDALARSLVPSANTYKSCYYTFTNNTASASKVFNPADYGNPADPGSVSATCNSELAALAPSIIPAGKTVKTCTYSVTRQVGTGAKDVLPSDHGLSPGSGTLSCNTSLRTYAQSLISTSAPGKILRNCTYTYTPPQPASPGTVRNCSFTDSTLNVAHDLCQGAAVTESGVSYPDLQALLRAKPAKCGVASLSAATYKGCTASRQGWKKTVSVQPAREEYILTSETNNVSIPQSLLPGSVSFVDSILARSEELFGTRGFFVSAIIHDTDLSTEGCDGGYRASPGKKYRDLVDRLGAQGNSYPICSPDYAPALASVHDFIIRTTLSSYQLALKEGELVEEVSIRRNGEVLSLENGKNYILNGKNLEFLNDIIQPGDIVVIKAFEWIKVRAVIPED
ncbi:MAG: hypothetical protein A2X94_15250 [Bdellovibrionales bacterium GWB1_55_8]|nr:MAG: hypothetical protein A2X94_15250 [Bdellovibrionales bacterium GWB1_55_8]